MALQELDQMFHDLRGSRTKASATIGNPDYIARVLSGLGHVEAGSSTGGCDPGLPSHST